YVADGRKGVANSLLPLGVYGVVLTPAGKLKRPPRAQGTRLPPQRGRRGRGRHSQGNRRKGQAVLDTCHTNLVDLGCASAGTPQSTADAVGTTLSSVSNARERASFDITPDPF